MARVFLVILWVALLLYLAAADSLLDKLGAVGFFAVGLLLLGGMLAGSMSRR